MRRVLVIPATLALLGGCLGTMYAAKSSASPMGTVTASSRSTSSARSMVSRPPSHPVSKLLVFVEENHSLDQMRQSMPQTFALAKEFGYATDYRAITHPSLPNYLVITGGSQYGVDNDAPPSAWRVRGHSIFGRALDNGLTARTYADSMPGACYTQDAGSYYVRHNPWTYFAGERQQCRKRDRSMPAFARNVNTGHLPAAGFVVPDACHDAHNCSLSDADRWFSHQMSTVMAGPDWRRGRLAVVLTADEDDRHSGNRVLTVVLHASQYHTVVTSPLDHFSLYGLYEDVLGLPHNETHRSPSMAKAFDLPLAR